MRHAWILVALAACKQGAGDYPINTGGDDTGDFHPQVDAPMADQSLGDGSAMISGRVCVLDDVRQPTVCRGTGAANITVKLGTVMTTTSDDGSFSLISPGGTNLTWGVTAANLVPAVVPLTASNVLHAIPTTLYEDMLVTNSVVAGAGEGAVVVFVRDQNGPVEDAAVTATPASATYDPLFDTGDELTWVAGDTGPLGVSWIPGLSAGTVRVTVTPASGSAQSFDAPIVGGAVTFTTAVF